MSRVFAMGDGRGAGHSVLVVPVPALEPYVVARTRHYDVSFVSDDPAFVHAHITLLAPFLPTPEPADLDLLAKIAGAAAPFEFGLARLGVMPGGTIYLSPEPAQPFAELTAELVTAFPQCSPYDGLYDPVPHLTVDHLSGDVTPADAAEMLGDLVPARCHADRISLQWYANHDCRTLAEWSLG